MGRQLDQLGSQLLQEELTSRNIDIYFNDEIERCLGIDTVEGIKLKSGLSIHCQAVIMAVGTIPNIELAKECGLDCKQGIIVNEYLQTSDPSIFAIGEISSFQGILHGISAAAEQQAIILARYLSETFKILSGQFVHESNKNKWHRSSNRNHRIWIIKTLKIIT
jgi:ferredoxin-nitrate reductase